MKQKVNPNGKAGNFKNPVGRNGSGEKGLHRVILRESLTIHHQALRATQRADNQNAKKVWLFTSTNLKGNFQSCPSTIRSEWLILAFILVSGFKDYFFFSGKGITVAA